MSMTVDELYGAMLIDPVKEVCGDKTPFYLGLAIGIFKYQYAFRDAIESAKNPYLVSPQCEDDKYIEVQGFKIKVFDNYKEGVQGCVDKNPYGQIRNASNPSVPTICIIASDGTLFNTGVSFEELQRIIDVYELKRYGNI